jgi:hypothetical protein
MKPHIEETCQQLLHERQSAVPFYGDDFWDWASVATTFMEVRPVSANAQCAAAREMDSFHEAVKQQVSTGLSIGDPNREWYGPAMAALAHRLLKELQSQALEPIVEGKYRGHDVPPRQVLWHYGQVVALFPEDTKDQARKLADFSWLKEPVEDAERYTRWLACCREPMPPKCNPRSLGHFRNSTRLRN